MTPCIEFNGTRNAAGYGIFTMKMGDHHHTVLAHRMAYAVAYGKEPNNMHVLHVCDNPSCINPEHLRLGTQNDNNKDRAAKKRSSTWARDATHCKRGHPFDEENTYIVKATGARRCRRCVKDRQAETYPERYAILRDAQIRSGLTQTEYRRQYGSSLGAALELLGRV